MARFPLLAGILWVLALGLLLYAGYSGQGSQRFETKESITITALVGIALLLRLYRLAEGPPMLSGNEADVALTSMQFIEGTRTNIFTSGWFSFPSLYSYMQSVFLRFINHGLFAIRLTSVLPGALTVGATYFYAKHAFDRRTAVVSAGILAFLSFHIHFSRYGLNNIWDGFFAVLLALTLSRAWSEYRPERYIMPGVALGLAQFFYVGCRVFFLLIPLWMVYMVILDRSRVKDRIMGMIILILSAIAVALPLLFFFIRHPLEYLAPLNRVGIFGEWWTIQTVDFGIAPWMIIADQALKAFLGFVAMPLRLLYGGQPLLAPPLAILFLFGLVVLVRRFREPDASWMVLWLLSTMLAVVLSVDAPAGQRYVLSSGAVAITTALGFEVLIKYTASQVDRSREIIKVLGACALAAALIWQAYSYFNNYYAKEAARDNNTVTAVGIGKALQMDDEISKAYFFVVPRMGLTMNEIIRFLVPGLTSEDIPDVLPWQVEVPGPGKYAFIFLPEREPALNAVIPCLPGGVILRDRSPDGRLLSLFYSVEAEEPKICMSP